MEKALLRKKCIAALVAITMTVGLMPIVTMAAETAEISCSVDGAEGVTNIGAGNDGYVTIDFSTDMDISTLNSTNITIQNGAGTAIEYTAEATARQYKIDKKYFSSVEDNGTATTLLGDTFTINVANVKTADETEQKAKTFSFTTGTVLPVSYKEGYVIENVALGKTVTELGTEPESGDKAENITDGKQNNDWSVLREKVSAAGDAAFQIDLGRKYDIVGVAVAGGIGNSFDPKVNSALWLSRYHLVGGSNRANITKMSDVETTYVQSGNTWMTYDQVRAKFFDGKTEQVRYIYGGTEQTPYSLYREIYVWAYIQPENMIESTYPENGETGVTNIGAGNNSLVTIDFNTDMNTSTLNSKNIVITNNAGEIINYTPYSVESRRVSIDKKYFSSVKDNGAVTSLDGDTFTVTINRVESQAGDIQKSYSFSFTTGTILPVSYKEDYIIENVALGKTVAELGTGKVSGDIAEYVTDGRQFNEWKVLREFVAKGNSAFSIDLGKKYDIAGVAIAGSNNDWYDQNQIVGGSNEPNKTAMSEVTPYIESNSNRIAWDQVKAKFYDYGATDAVQYIYAGSSITCLACRELYAWAYIKTENTVESTYPENGAKGISNVGVGNNSLVTINFNTDMDIATLTPENVTVKNSDGKEIDYVPYSVSSRKLTIDKKYFSSINDNGAVTTLDGDKFTVSINGAKILNSDIRTYYSFSFTTGVILPVSYKAGYTIENVALGKTVTELGVSKIDGDNAEYVTDGRQFNEWKVLREKVIPGNAAFKIDLEKQYDIAGIAIAGVNNAFYDRNQIIGGSNSADKTVMSDVSTYIKADINTIDWNQMKAKFYDYGSAEPVQYIYAGSSQEWLACRELYVWAYVQSGDIRNIVKTMQPANRTKNITNVTNTVLNDFVYVEDYLTVNFTEDTDMSTVTNETLTLSQKKEPNIKYHLIVDGDKHEARIPVSDLGSRLDYTLHITDGIKTVDGVSATEEQLTFSTGEIAKISYSAGKTIKNSALNKSVALSDGTALNKYTNGLLRGYDGNAEKMTQYKDDNPIYAIIDLGEEKTVASLSVDGSENTEL